jgi:CheY-like chemotaxis protein
VVDDDEGVCHVLDAGLRQHSCTSWPAASDEDAIELYRERREAVDANLLDEQMLRRPGGPRSACGKRLGVAGERSIAIVDDVPR